MRIIHPLAVEKITDQHQLYDFAKSVNWLDWFTPDKTIAVRAIVSQAPAFNNSAFVALKVKDYIGMLVTSFFGGFTCTTAGAIIVNEMPQKYLCRIS